MFRVMSATFFGPPSGPDEFPQESLAQRVCNLDKSFLGSWVLLRVDEVWDTHGYYMGVDRKVLALSLVLDELSYAKMTFGIQTFLTRWWFQICFFFHSYLGKMNPF